jgi:hypothetical protein
MRADGGFFHPIWEKKKEVAAPRSFVIDTTISAFPRRDNLCLGAIRDI